MLVEWLIKSEIRKEMCLSLLLVANFQSIEHMGDEPVY